MSRRPESRSRRAKPATTDLSEVLVLRASKLAKGMLETRAKELAIPPAILHRQVLYRFLGLIDEEK